jgi:hypothetical protein
MLNRVPKLLELVILHSKERKVTFREKSTKLRSVTDETLERGFVAFDPRHDERLMLHGRMELKLHQHMVSSHDGGGLEEER